MAAVWKYVLGELPHSRVQMPAGAELLWLGVQDNVPCLWALVDPGADREDRWFFHVGTGFNFDPPGDHVGSYQLDLPGGVFVGHVFEGGAIDAEAA